MDQESKEHSAYILRLETELHEVEKREEAATRRMQLLVYPTTIAFIILSAYGFYLVRSLTQDVSRMASSVAIMNGVIKDTMPIISRDTIAMSKQMDNLIDSTSKMNVNVSNLVVTTQKMSKNVNQMSFYTGYMQQDVWSLNKNISKPLSLLNAFIPWSSDTSDWRSGSLLPYQTVHQPLRLNGAITKAAEIAVTAVGDEK